MDSPAERLLETIKCREQGLVALEVEKSFDPQIIARLLKPLLDAGLVASDEMIARAIAAMTHPQTRK